MTDIRIALIGNPNCGKTTLFNDLTGAHQKVGNWPGVTVDQFSGHFNLDGKTVEVIDLPGIYSLEQEAPGLDEQIARDYLATGEYDLVVNIIDAANLQRNLILTSQLLDQELPLVIAMNMLDVAEDQGVLVNVEKLAAQLAVPVVPIIASRRQGVDELLHQVQQAVATQDNNAHEKAQAFIHESKAVDREDSMATGIAAMTSDGMTAISHINAASASDGKAAGSDASVGDTLIKRYHRAQAIVDGVVQMQPVQHTMTERIDAWVLNKWLGLPIFLAMMYLMFTVAINVGAIFIDFFDLLFGALAVDALRWLLNLAGSPLWLTVLLADGLGGGVQLVATFIPVIGMLFLCLSLLESSGYMARAGFVIDRMMSSLGLPGNAFVPLIVGFGCNVPAVMAARSMSRESDRLLTIAMAPFMSCGARLTVYALFAAALFPVNGQNVVFGLYLLGIAMAILTGWLFRRQIFAGEVSPSFQEMPAYHVPVLRNILLSSWFRLRDFIFRAGKTIVLVVVCISFLNSFGTDGSFGNEDSDRSVLAAIGKTITPIFSPMGLHADNWPATVGLFTGLFAKEAVVGTLDALYAESQPGAATDGPPDLLGAGLEAGLSILDNAAGLLGSLADPLGIRLEDATNTAEAALQQGVEQATLTNMAQMFGSQFAAFCYLVFVLLYAPCVAVLGATAKEAGWKYMLLMFSWTTGLAYITATCVFQLGMVTEQPVFALAWLAGSALVAAIAVKLLRSLGSRTVPARLIATTQVN